MADEEQGVRGAPSAQVKLNGKLVTLSLSDSGAISWQAKGSKGNSGSLHLADEVLGFIKGATSITLHALVLKPPGCFKGPRREKETVLIEFDDVSAHDVWCRALERSFQKESRPKKLTVLVNPASGSGKSLKMFENTVEPLLRAAGVQVDLRETKYRNHAKEIGATLNVQDCDGIVCVSGDGVLVEVLNGLLSRPDWQEAIKIPLGVVPAGSGNGMCKSLLSLAHEPCEPAAAVLAIVKGQTRALDVFTTSQGQESFHGVLSVAWGLVSDVDIESEAFRWLGSARFTVQTIIRLISLRRYTGALHFIPAQEQAPGSSSPLNHPKESLLPDGVSINLAGGGEGGGQGWQTIEGEFLLLWVGNVPWATFDMNNAPKAELSDGRLDVLLVRSASRGELLSLFLKMEKGDHISHPKVEYFKVRALRLEPQGFVGGNGRGGYLVVDGEVMARGQGTRKGNGEDPMAYGPSMEVVVRKGLARVFCASR